MKVIHMTDENIKLTKQEKSKIAILKLVESGKYVEGVGIKDNEFYILTEDNADETWLLFTYGNNKCTTSRIIIGRLRNGRTKSY